MNQATDTAYTPKQGDRVVVQPEYASAAMRGVVYTVDKIHPVNIVLKPVDGIGRGVRCKPYQVAPAPTGDAPAPTGDAPATDSTLIAFQPQLHVGQVVKYALKPGGFYVVLRSGSRPDTYSIVKLGGDSGRYWNRVPRSHLVPVTVDTITATDAA